MGKITYAIPEAISKAQNIVANPEVLLSQAQVVALLDAMLGSIQSSPCFYKAQMTGRKTFVLVDSDPAAPFAIRVWADEAERIGHQREKVLDARAIAYAFSAAPKKNPGAGTVATPGTAALNPQAAWPFPPDRKVLENRLQRALSALRSYDPALADHIEKIV